MKITILSVGTIKEKYFIDAIKEYSKRISKYSKVDFITVSDEAIPDNASLKEEEIIKNKEGEKILKSIPSNSYKIALDLKGEMLDSVELANKISDIARPLSTSRDQTIQFVLADIYAVIAKQILTA